MKHTHSAAPSQIVCADQKRGKLSSLLYKAETWIHLSFVFLSSRNPAGLFSFTLQFPVTFLSAGNAGGTCGRIDLGGNIPCVVLLQRSHACLSSQTFSLLSHIFRHSWFSFFKGFHGSDFSHLYAKSFVQTED